MQPHAQVPELRRLLRFPHHLGHAHLHEPPEFPVPVQLPEQLVVAVFLLLVVFVLVVIGTTDGTLLLLLIVLRLLGQGRGEPAWI